MGTVKHQHLVSFTTHLWFTLTGIHHQFSTALPQRWGNKRMAKINKAEAEISRLLVSCMSQCSKTQEPIFPMTQLKRDFH